MEAYADGYAERDAALLMLAEKQDGRSHRIPVGKDKVYETKDFVSTVRELNVTPHVTKNDKAAPAIWTAEPRASPAMPSARVGNG
jgi:hypothetical protein